MLKLKYRLLKGHPPPDLRSPDRRNAIAGQYIRWGDSLSHRWMVRRYLALRAPCGFPFGWNARRAELSLALFAIVGTPTRGLIYTRRTREAACEATLSGRKHRGTASVLSWRCSPFSDPIIWRQVGARAARRLSRL